ncbi:MAG: zinc ribbon domain-containing protein [Acidimicrobiia bacterium]
MEELNSLEDLLDLQVLDTDIDRLLDHRASLPELEAYRAAHAELTGLDGQLQVARDRMREIDLSTDKAEGELSLAEDKANREEQRLYAGGLSARDAEHMRNEVQMLRRQISEQEEMTLALMEEREGLQTILEGLEQQHEAVAAEKGRIEAVVADSWREIDGDVARLEEKKAALIPLIAPDILAMYEEIRPTKEGVAVARLGEGVCGACHLALSAAEQVQAAKQFPPRCIHCWRMLVLQ